MAYWVELRCDVNAVEGCYSYQNRGPTILIRTFAVGIAPLTNEANQRGWRRTARGWECPACMNQTRKEYILPLAKPEFWRLKK